MTHDLNGASCVTSVDFVAALFLLDAPNNGDDEDDDEDGRDDGTQDDGQLTRESCGW